MNVGPRSPSRTFGWGRFVTAGGSFIANCGRTRRGAVEEARGRKTVARLAGSGRAWSKQNRTVSGSVPGPFYCGLLGLLVGPDELRAEFIPRFHLWIHVGRERPKRTLLE